MTSQPFQKLLDTIFFGCYDRICPTYLPYIWLVVEVIFVSMATGVIFFGVILGLESTEG